MKYILKITAIAVILVHLSSCSKDFEDINTNPNSLTQSPPPTNILGGAILNITSTAQSNLGFAVGGSWSQQVARRLYPEHDIYKYRDMSSDWRTLYAAANNLQALIKTVKAKNLVNMEAVARVMKVYDFQIITDLWGDVPYSDALKGAESPAIFSPEYDTQQSIYADLIRELKAANALFDPAADKLGEGDYLYKGDINKWKKFCNSLLLRVYIRMSGVDPATAKQGIETILGDPAQYPVFTANSDDASLAYYDVPDQRNPTFVSYTANTSIDVPGQLLITMLQDRNDPRLPVYARPAKVDGKYRGQPNGDRTLPADSLSTIAAKYVETPSAPLHLLTYAEILFIKAEAANSGWNTGGVSAKDAYEEAIKSSMSKQGAAIGTYLSEPKVDFNLASGKARLIAEQKWIALYLQGVEAFSEYRRTGYPSEIKEVPKSAYPGLGTPVRYPYPTSEAATNPANLAAAQAGIQNTLFGKKLWWAKP